MILTIPVICRTNRDDYDTTVVTELLCPPRVGDYVEVKYKGNRSRLKIVSITHRKTYTELELNE